MKAFAKTAPHPRGSVVAQVRCNLLVWVITPFSQHTFGGGWSCYKPMPMALTQV